MMGEQPVSIAWGQVPGNVRVQLSTGRVVRILDRIPGRPDLVLMRAAHGDTRLVTVDPLAPAQVLIGTEEQVAAALRTRFPHVEFIREERP